MKSKGITLKELIKNEEFEENFEIIEVNNGIPFTFTEEDLKVKEGKPKYTDSIEFGRSGPATAIISPKTISIYSSKDIKYPNPINWSKLKKPIKKSNTTKDIVVYNRCHIIAYHLSARFTVLDNIFIGTEYLNNGNMKEIEKSIYDKVKNNKRTFLYKVTPVYKEKEDIVPIGVLFEYETIDAKKDKIVACKFCYNIEKGYKIDYKGKKDSKHFKTVSKKTSFVSPKRSKYKNYYVRVDEEIKKFHLIYDDKERCEDLKYVRRKNIQEVTGKKEEIVNSKDEKTRKNFIICNKCEREYAKRIEKN